MLSSTEEIMEKRTIAEIAVDVLKAAKEPLSISEITQVTLDKGLYSFNTQDPKGIVRGAIERRCEGLNRKDSTTPKFFKKLADGKYQLLSNT